MKIYGCYLTTTYVSFVFVYKVDHLWKISETNNVKSVKEHDVFWIKDQSVGSFLMCSIESCVSFFNFNLTINRNFEKYNIQIWYRNVKI